MTDCFALLGEPRRPGIDTDALKARFHSLAAGSHPDRFHNAPPEEQRAANDRHAALNSAYATLREAKDRLGHLLELEHGGRPRGIEGVPADLMERFMQVARVCQEVDQFLAGRGAVTSPLLKVQQFQKAMAWTEKLSAQIGELATLMEASVQSASAWNAAWESAPPVGSPERASKLPLTELEVAFRRVSFLTRWQAQLRERVGKLAS